MLEGDPPTRTCPVCRTGGRAFLEGYLSVQKDIDERWLSVYQAASLLKIAGRRFRSLTYLEWPLVIHLIQGAYSAITEDLANLEAATISDIGKGTLVAHFADRQQ